MSTIQNSNPSLTAEASNDDLNVLEMTPLVHSMTTNDSLICGGALKLPGPLFAIRTSNETMRFDADTHSSGPPSMQRVPRPGLLSKRSAKCFIMGSKGRSLLKREDLIHDKRGGGQRTVVAVRGDVGPEEGELLTVHPGRQSQAGILSERWDDRGEDQSDEDKTGRKDDLTAHKEQPLI